MSDWNRRRIVEETGFSTGNGGAMAQIVRVGPEGDPNASYRMVTQVAHFGLTMSSEFVLNDTGVVDEMIDMLVRARKEMVRDRIKPGYPGPARISRRVIDSVPIVPPLRDAIEFSDCDIEDEEAEGCDTDEEGV